MRMLLTHCDMLAGESFASLKDVYLGIDGDTIDYIGAEKPEEPYDLEKDMSDRLILPGLINCHGHSAMVLMRGLGSDLPLQEWLFEKMVPVENRLTEEEIRAGNALALLEMIACGTTSYSDMYFKPATAVENALSAGIKANLCRPVQTDGPDERYESNVKARESLQFFRDYQGAGDGKILVDFAIHAEYTCSPDVARGYAADCKSLGARMQLHLSETAREHRECIERYGKTPARWFCDLGVFDVPASAAHCVAVTDEDLQIFLEKGVSPIHNPSSNMKLGSGFAPVPKMLDMGLNVALGTDGAASNNNLNMFEEMHLAAVLHNGYTHDPVLMKPAQVLAMATQNGAKLQGRPNTGVLEVGKKADLIALDLDRPHLQPNLDPLALVVYAAQGSDVVMTMVDGKILYENGEYLTLDREKILYEAAQAVKRLYG